MGRVLGIDVGDRRTGIAVSDALGITCRPLTVVQEADRRLLGLEILRLAAEQGATKLVVGLPRPLGGGSSAQLERSQEVAGMLARIAGIPVETWSERFTTKMAKRLKPGQGHADAVAAAFMLQNYLDARMGQE